MTLKQMNIGLEAAVYSFPIFALDTRYQDYLFFYIGALPFATEVHKHRLVDTLEYTGTLRHRKNYYNGTAFYRRMQM